MPDLCIVIATWNRCERLRGCLDALTRQSLPPDEFEVVVVVDGSTDGTMAMLDAYRSPWKLRVVRQDNAGQAVALNRGLEEASGRFCLFLDDDIIAEPGLAAAHLSAQRSHDGAAIIGQLRIEIPADADWYARAFARGWRDHYQALDAGLGEVTWEDCYGGNLSAPRATLLAVGGFATNLRRGYDVELGWRLEQAGCRLIHAPEAVGCQDERKGFGALTADAANSGESEVALYERDPRMMSSALGSFAAGGWRKLLAWRCLLALRLPPRLLALAGLLTRDESRRYSWHSFIQHYCYWRGVRRGVSEPAIWRALTSGVPILMYHATGQAGERASTYVMPVTRFRKHLRWIGRFGYRVVSLEEFIDCQRTRSLLPARSVVITFDDGYADNYALACPVLRRHGMPATIFLVTGCVGHAATWVKHGPLAGRALMSWEQVRQLTPEVSFGGQTRSHPKLPNLPAPLIDEQIRGCREDLEHELGRPAPAFAYPYGEHDETVRAAVRDAGFAAACTVDPGLNGPRTPLMALRRAEIRGTDSVFRLWLALRLGDADAILPRRPDTRESQ